MASVLGEDLRNESIDPRSAGVRGEPLEQTARDPAVLELVGDGEGDLGARRVAQPNPGPEPDHALGAVGVDQLADQRQALVAVTAEKRRDQVGVDTDSTLKTQVAALRRQSARRTRAAPARRQRWSAAGGASSRPAGRRLPGQRSQPCRQCRTSRDGAPSAEGRRDGAGNYVSGWGSVSSRTTHSTATIEITTSLPRHHWQIAPIGPSWAQRR